MDPPSICTTSLGVCKDNWCLVVVTWYFILKPNKKKYEYNTKQFNNNELRRETTWV